MAANFVTKDEFEDWRDDLMGYFNIALDKAVRSSERRLMSEIQRVEKELYTEVFALREDFDALRTEVRTEIGALRTEMRKDFAGMQGSLNLIMKHLGIEH